MKKKSWTRKDIVKAVAAGIGLDRAEVESVVDGVLYSITDALKQGKRVDLRRFGAFRVQQRAARMARNPSTNQPVKVAAHKVPVFRPSRELKDAVNQSSQEDS